ncbi:MAG: c-type cytochrome biogenesis protein CcmI [Geminicoccaceae bacterium]|nr:c-type cytochrome biogenesis protein CcmI [Geminicoccaceae bacterium]HRY26279.1 c-type cytochrome biogenesis protein CcmI [Geminicoccaceae bacterium]
MSGWSLLAGLGPLAIAVLALVLPLLRRRTADAAADSAVAILKDQLAELGRDVERGLLQPEEARAARVEIERRLLRAADRATPHAFEAGRIGRALVLVALVAVPLGATALYLRLGSPSLPDRPFASRADERQGPAVPEQILTMVASLEARLATDGDDPEGWLMLGRSRFVLGRLEPAIEAYRRALELAPEQAEAVAGLADALMARSQGVVTPEVQALMRRLAALAPGDPRPPYFQGLAAAQAGDFNAALEQWRAMLEAAPADAPWRAQVEPSIRQAAAELGLDPEPILALARTPTAEEDAAAAMAALPPEERQARIRAMVDGLQSRLETSGGSVDEWQRLGQARLVLGERDAAIAAYREALAQAPDNPAALKGLAAALVDGPAEPDGLPVVGDEALALFEQAATVAPDDPEPHWYLGIRALADGNPATAREHWETVLAGLDPTSPDWATVRARLDQLD